MLQIGTLLRAKDVAWQQIGGNAGLGQIARPRTAAGNLNLELDQRARAEVYGAALRSSVMAGEPISRGAIVKPGNRDFLQVVLSPQARAIAIPVTTGGASTGILYPGDRVDVILTQTFKNDPPLARRSVGETVVENLRVLAIDALESRPNGTANGFGRTVTLEVTPEQAERVNVATELGKLSLTLRSVSATNAVVSSPVGLTRTAGIKPIWAGDVSPALGDAGPAERDRADFSRPDRGYGNNRGHPSSLSDRDECARCRIRRLVCSQITEPVSRRLRRHFRGL
jgi:pilus assembly protein CpaB